MKILYAILACLLLTACVGGPMGPSAKYTVDVYDPTSGRLVKHFEGISEREFEYIETSYENGKFVFNAGKTTSTVSPLEAAVTELGVSALKRGLLLPPDGGN